MASFVFPPNPALNDTVEGSRGETYLWDGTKWTWAPARSIEIHAAGSDREIQFNDKNAFGASHFLTYRPYEAYGTPINALMLTGNQGATSVLNVQNSLIVGGPTNVSSMSPTYIAPFQNMHGILMYYQNGSSSGPPFNGESCSIQTLADVPLEITAPLLALNTGGYGALNPVGIGAGGADVVFPGYNSSPYLDLLGACLNVGIGTGAYSYNVATRLHLVSSGQWTDDNRSFLHGLSFVNYNIYWYQQTERRIAEIGCFTEVNDQRSGCLSFSTFKQGVQTESIWIDSQGRVGIYMRNQQWALDVSGDINITDSGMDMELRAWFPFGYSYRINGIIFASLTWDGTQINLTNIATINGSPVGGGGGSQWSDGAGGIIYYNSGNVGVGVSNPAARVQIHQAVADPPASNAVNAPGAFLTLSTPTTYNGQMAFGMETSNGYGWIQCRSTWVGSPNRIRINPSGGQVWLSGQTLVADASYVQIAARLELQAGSDLIHHGTSGILQVDNLPSSPPAAGTKRLWYDPADGNTVKFAV